MYVKLLCIVCSVVLVLTLCDLFSLLMATPATQTHGENWKICVSHTKLVNGLI